MDALQRPDLTLGPLFSTFLLGFTTVVLILWYSYRKQQYWKKIGAPHTKSYPLFGSVLENISKPLHDTEQDRYNKYGRIYGHYEGNRPLLSVGDPEILRSILVKDFQAFSGRRIIKTGSKITDSMVSNLQGEDWKRVRTIVTPTFTTGKIKRMMGIFKDCSQTLLQNFKEATNGGKIVDAKMIYGAFTMDIIASSAFSTKIDSRKDPNNEFVATARQVFTRNLNWRFVLFTLWPWVMTFFKISVFSPRGLKFFTDVTLQIIAERKKTGQRRKSLRSAGPRPLKVKSDKENKPKRNDFLQLLMDTANELSEEGKVDPNEKDDITENYGKEENNEVFKPTALTKKTLSTDELIAQCVIFFLAGYDTTASTLSFTSYFLALNPDVQEKLIEELDDALRENNGELTYEAVQSMKYLDNVISETLRLYPPAIRLERVADEDYPLGDTGLTIPKGMVVTIPVYAMHRDPNLFPDPEKFDPDRFTPEERAKRNPYAYLPFGAGPRNCVGMRFALMEIKVCLAHVLSNFRIKRCPETKVPLDWYIGQGLLQPKHITFSLEVRKDAVKTL